MTETRSLPHRTLNTVILIGKIRLHEIDVAVANELLVIAPVGLAAIPPRMRTDAPVGLTAVARGHHLDVERGLPMTSGTTVGISVIPHVTTPTGGVLLTMRISDEGVSTSRRAEDGTTEAGVEEAAAEAEANSSRRIRSIVQ